VDSLSDGYDTIVGERGSKLSGGQQQRIGIARALYNNPSVLVLDEATSNLDLRTEARVIEAVKQLKGKKTIIIISHRVSTLEYCDLLFEIKDGKIILSD
jgi:ABC-type bacteriocin/lantibiotic exporter with double-glycine peptidase domain